MKEELLHLPYQGLKGQAEEWWSFPLVSTPREIRCRPSRSRSRPSSLGGSVTIQVVSNTTINVISSWYLYYYRSKLLRLPADVLGHGHHLIYDGVHLLQEKNANVGQSVPMLMTMQMLT